MSDTVIGRHTVNVFPRKVINRLEHDAELARQALGTTPNHEGRLASLELCACLVRTLTGINSESEDPRLVALQHAYAAVAGGNTPSYDPPPGSEQSRLLAQAGLIPSSSPPSAEGLLHELVSCAVIDAVSALQTAATARSATEREVAQLRPSHAQAIEAQETAQRLTARVAELEQELATASETVRLFRDSHQGTNGPTNKPARRTKVDGHPGIYSRLNADSEPVYEVGWTESGRQRWHIVGTNLDEAISYRDQMTAEVPA